MRQAPAFNQSPAIPTPYRGTRHILLISVLRILYKRDPSSFPTSCNVSPRHSSFYHIQQFQCQLHFQIKRSCRHRTLYCSHGNNRYKIRVGYSVSCRGRTESGKDTQTIWETSKFILPHVNIVGDWMFSQRIRNIRKGLDYDDPQYPPGLRTKKHEL